MQKKPSTDEVYAEQNVAVNESRAAALLSVPVSVTISIGKVKATIEELLELGPEAILPLDSRIDDPVDLIVGPRVIARGRLVELGDDGAFGVEVIALVDEAIRE